jgi:uncharacterized membrane protein YdjX (TVP38/TMEM64 family)
MKIYPDNWRVRLTTGVVAAACIAATLILGPAVGINGFWPGMLSVVVAIIVGNVLGLLVCRLLFRPRDMEKNDEKK